MILIESEDLIAAYLLGEAAYMRILQEITKYTFWNLMVF